jgi:hypothetical protein
MTPSPTDEFTGEKQRRSRPVRVKSPSGQEYEIEWTSDDV